ncbi:MAG TPA: serine/threonine-protein kinase, partial [Pyrinomonadaceae bacterium]|nr:serine/threonine-protein kinase [Pyrinomonadaceae bacterium]
LDREVAIKMLRPELARQAQVVERFRSEAVTLAKLNHPNIATLYSFQRQNDDFFMVMEYVSGETLDDLIRRQGAMPTEHAISLFSQALEGIGRAHKLVIIHRDIKPANMMLTEDGSIKVMDFGIARVLGTARMTRQGNIVGTIEYMSPEAIQGADVDARSDIYSLGILLYEMLTGRVPFVNDTEYSLMMAQINEPPPPPRTFAPHIPAHIEQAVMKALAKRPDDRFQSVGDFRRALEHHVSAPVHAAAIDGVRPGPAPVQQAGPAGLSVASVGIKETRLAGSSVNPAANVARSQAPKETRWTDAEVARSTGPVLAGHGTQQRVASGSFLDRLSWMHYAGAAVVLFVVVGVLVLVIAGVIWTRPGVQSGPASPEGPAADQPGSAGVQSAKPQEQPSASPETPKVGAISPITVPPQNTGTSTERGAGSSGSKSTQKKVDPAAAERARRAAEARRLLREQ